MLSLATNMAALNVKQAQNIAALQRPKGRQVLLEALDWEIFDEEDNPRQGILMDFHYDNLMFCAQKGFPWSETCALVDVAAKVLEKSKGQGLIDSIKIYQDECQSCCASFGEQNIKIFTEYFFNTFMHHYKLYQYVNTTDQEDLKVQTNLVVDTPPTEPLAFTESKAIKLWEYEQKVKQVETEEQERSKEREKEKEDKGKEYEEHLQQSLQELQKCEQPIERENLITLINDIASAHITAAGHSIKSDIVSAVEDVDFMLQKTIIPRPQDLGPPPRYKTKTPLGGKRPKSTKGKEKSQPASRSTSKIGKAK